MIRRPPRSTPKPSSAASDVYKRQSTDHPPTIRLKFTDRPQIIHRSSTGQRPAQLFEGKKGTPPRQLFSEASASKARKNAKQEPGTKRPCFASRLRSPVHFVKAPDQSCRLDLGCSSIRRAPKSYNDGSSLPQQSAGYVWKKYCMKKYTISLPTTPLSEKRARGDRKM